jgi:gluconolactonase
VVALSVGACSSEPSATPTGSTSDGAASFDGQADDSATSDSLGPWDPSGGDAARDGSRPEGPVGAADAPGDNKTGSDGTVGRDGPDAGPPGGARTVGELYCASEAAPFPDPLPANLQPSVVPIAPPGGISFLEGPLWLADRGVLLVSEWNGGHRILQLTPPQTIEVFMPASGSNGLAVTPDGKSLLMVTEMPAASVSRVSLADKSVQAIAQNYNGQGFLQPNDLAVRADGIIYFTDYQAGRLYRRALDGTILILSSLPRSNGVGFSPDEKTLYLRSPPTARSVKARTSPPA